MTRIYDQTAAPSEFMENIAFNDQLPYIVQRKTYLLDDIVPLHCARTIEILACSGLSGTIMINNISYPLCGNQVFVIPPYVIHSNHIYSCNGFMHQFQTDFLMLKQYIDIKSILRFNGIDVSQLAYSCPEFDKIDSLLASLIDHDNDFSICITCISQIFTILRNYCRSNAEIDVRINSNKNEIMRNIIVWTQENYSKHISLDEISKLVGYSKFHICSRFKEATGMTYIDYLNSVRISNACTYLKEGMSINDACHSCGFNNVSYFIQVFKKIHGMTPRTFIKNYNTTIIN